jgi:serine/threonine protein kinase/tetratricopeptide (TPR) repeat protein
MDIAGRRFGVYDVVSSIGTGGMGRVYRATDTRLRRPVALKLLHEDLVPSHKLLRRFEREAQAASALNHPNIVTIYEVGEAEGLHFIAMEYVEGERLRDVMRRQTPSLRTILKVANGIADGLAAAHANGIVHRDLKPENVMISADGFVKILDFGLAKLLQTEDAEPSADEQTARISLGHSGPGTVVGTPNYMSPEQIAGNPIDHRSDQFSFGSILYEMITGRRPFDRATQVETMTAVLREEPTPLKSLISEVPLELIRITERCLQKEKAERYDSTADLAHDIRELRDRSSTDATPLPRTDFRKTSRIRKTAVAAATAAVLIALLWLASPLLLRETDAASQPVVAASLLPAQKYMAILPFESQGGSVEEELYARGMSEAVSARLSALKGIQIIPPSVTGSSGELSQMSREFGANLVLKTMLRQMDHDMLRATYEILDPRTGLQLAAGVVDGSLSNPFIMEDRVADRILHSLEMKLDLSLPTPAHEIFPGGAQDRYLQALGALQQYQDESSVDLAIEILRDLQQIAPDSALIGAALGRGYVYKHQLTSDGTWAARAQESCDRMMQLDPALPEVHITCGEWFIRQGRYEDAILRFRRVLSDRPTSVEAALGLAQALDRAGRDEAALVAYQQAIELRPTYWAGYNRLGAFHFGRGRAEAAARQFQEVVKLMPENTRGHNNLGGAYFSLGRFEEAAAALRKSLEIAESAVGWSNLGTALYYTGQYGPAVEAFERATALSPERTILWLNLGDAYRRSKDRKPQAAEAYRRVIELGTRDISINRTDALAHAIIASAYAKLGQHNLSEQFAARAVALGPQDLDVLFASAVVAILNGNEESALHFIQRTLDAGGSRAAIARDPEFTSLHGHEQFKKLVLTDRDPSTGSP